MRTPDIEEVGKTTRHGTFFQMCGNFSFGDYFKEDAITYAWELLTTPQDKGGYGLEGDRLWITVYEQDDEAEAIWRDVVGVPAERIQRLGMDSNFWSMGVPGPCGPCSEINYDRGPEFGEEGGPAVNDERYVEIWNLVFMQYVRGAGEGKNDFPILGDLPAKNIDTGLGLERLAMILQGVQNMYETDTLRVVIDKATELTGVPYGRAHDTDVALRVVADHMRTSMMLIGDGVTPATRAAATSCAGSCAAPSATCGCSARTRRSPPNSSTWCSPPWASSTRSCSPSASGSRRWRSPRRPPSSRRCGPAPTSWTPRSARPRPAVAASSPATRRSCSTTPGASRSTSPWRWPRNRACPWTRRASGG